MAESNKAAMEKKRLLSVDALRGFDMFWIMGAEGIFSALFLITGFSIFQVFDQQMKHAVWHGFTAYDLIFPLFIFLSGVSIGIAAKPLKSYPLIQQRQLTRHAYKRLTLLLLLGIVYNHGWGQGIPTSPDEIRFASVLGRIGIAWFAAMMIVWYCSVKMQWLIAVAILISYWLLLALVNIGEYGGGIYSPELALNVWFDQQLLPGITYRNAPMDPEGILSNIPSVVNALAGVFAGRYLKAWQAQPQRILRHFFAIGLLSIALGSLWGCVFPVNKSLWTSSFVLVTVGCSTLLLALFYLVIDVWQWQRWAKFFAVIGVNSIVIYLSTSLFSWNYFAHSLFGGVASGLSEGWSSLIIICGALLLQWLFLNWLYKRKIFIKV
ncbi:transmembrane glucosamine N-acetyltransferase NagX [Colwellia sp. MEBiC06753]